MQFYTLVEPSILNFVVSFSVIGAEIVLTWVCQAAKARQTHSKLSF